MALGRKGLTCGVMKLLTVCCFTPCCVHHTALDGCAMHSHPKQCARADREENCIVYIQFSSP
ncbi:unnamed protein product [Staurois parvus]|uniref:Secreted protein n=1 Tax=Staurois parvus TaxID=386267 RepID=A0ABN9FEA3_9NEOB|nr:unnamed protein product [Staurois parvus]